MNFKEVNIYPNIKKTVNLVKMKIEVIEMTLFESVVLSVLFYDENDMPIESRVFKMDKSNGYNEWNNDDAYVVEWIKKQLKIGIYA
jgi:hypothetical protein